MCYAFDTIQNNFFPKAMEAQGFRNAIVVCYNSNSSKSVPSMVWGKIWQGRWVGLRRARSIMQSNSL